MFLLAILALPALGYLGGELPSLWLAMFIIPLIFSTLGPTVLYTVSQHHLHPHDWKSRIALLPALVLVGFGICISNTRAVAEALLGIESGFIRTPKRGTKVAKSYKTSASLIPILEILAAVYCAISLFVYARHEIYGIVPFLFLYVAGFALVGISSLREQSHASRP